MKNIERWAFALLAVCAAVVLVGEYQGWLRLERSACGCEREAEYDEP